MYIPKHNQKADRDAIVGFMKKYSFATLVSAKDELPLATHLPFHIEEKNDALMLTSHMARANPQWQQMEGRESLVIFAEPHAYISPKNYEKQMNVPTWNYTAVHAYGKVHLLLDDQAVFEVLEKTIQFYEADYFDQWKMLPDTYKNRMIKGIVAFEMVVTNLQAKDKLSQNKTRKEQENVIRDLRQNPDTTAQEVAKMMQNKLEKNSSTSRNIK